MFAPFLHGMQGPIIRPPNIDSQLGGRSMPVGPSPFRPMPGRIEAPAGPAPGQLFGGNPLTEAPFQAAQPPQQQFHTMPGTAQPMGSFDNLKHIHTIKKSGLYRLKKGEKVVPLSSLAHV